MSEILPDKAPDLPSPRNPVLSLLASLKFALVVILLIALACIAGTLIPQGSQADAFLEQNPGAQRVMHILSILGLTRVFYAWWFALLLFVLAASLVVCTYRRYLLISRTTWAVRARVAGSFITHVSLLLVFAGGVVRVLWVQKGTLQMHEGDTVTHVASPDGLFPLPFSVRLVKFDLEYYESKSKPVDDLTGRLLLQWADKKIQTDFPIATGVVHSIRAPDAPAGAPAAFTVTVLQYVPDFMIDSASGEAKSRSAMPNNPAVQIEICGGGAPHTQWIFARFPDFASHDGDPAAQPLAFRFVMVSASALAQGGPDIKAYKSTLEVLENGVVVQKKVIAVNSPFTHRGYTFYQLSYDPQDLTWSSLQVVKDPSVPLIYAGFLLMMAGLTVVFCLGPWIDGQRRKKGGTP